MKKFWQLVSKRHLVFLLVIFALAILLSIHTSSNRVKVHFGEDLLAINSSKYSMNIVYTDMDDIDLVDSPDLGTMVEGNNTASLRSGEWENELWGEYSLCMDPDASQCIVIHLKDGRVFVFNRKDNAETSKLFETLQTYLPAE